MKELLTLQEEGWKGNHYLAGWQRHSQGREISKAQVLFTHHATGKAAYRPGSPGIKLRELALLTLLYVALLSHLDYYLAVDIMPAGLLGPIENPQNKRGKVLEVSHFSE